MGLPPASASRPSKDDSPFNSDSNQSIHPLLAKIKPRLTEPVALDSGVE